MDQDGRPMGQGFRQRAVFAAFAALGLATLFAALWALRSLVLLTFFAVVLSVVLRSLGDMVHKATGLPRNWSALVVALLSVVLAVGAAILLAPTLTTQAKGLVGQLPGAVDSLRQRIGDIGWLSQAWDHFSGQFLHAAPGEAMSQATRVLGVATDSLGNLVFVMFTALFLALSPTPYFLGTVSLVPPRHRDFTARLLRELGDTLQSWLGGQLVMMILVGLLAGLGLWALGVPYPLALGLFAGLLDFVPYVGPIVGAGPAVILALSQSPTTALWTIALFFAVQNIEGYVLQPFIQRQSVDIPPALLLVFLFGMGQLFGLTGLLVATPLLAILLVVVRRLYVELLLEGTDKAGQA